MNILHKIYCRTFQLCFRMALPFLPYREPAILNNFTEITSVLEKKGIDKVLLVTDKGISSCGLLEGLLQELNHNQITCTVFDETVPNPTIDNIEKAREIYLKDSCGAIIAFGGGSSIDCAKITAARIAKPKQSVQKMKGLLKIWKKLPLLIAIPTTAGTGSETTLAAVITDATTHHKYPINDFSLIPPYAVLDYHVTLGLPAHLTATTGMDALTHAVEAYIGGSTTRHTRQMAEEAITLIHGYLKRAYDDGSDAEAREKMLRASYCAGIAFTQSYVGYVHGIAHSLGGQYGVPHGLANAIILPHVLNRYGKSCYGKLSKLAKRCNIASSKDTTELAALKFISWIKEMNRYMNIPKYIDGIHSKDIPTMAAHAAKESNPLYPVPKLMNKKELEMLYYIIGGKHLSLVSKTESDVSYANRKIS